MRLLSAPDGENRHHIGRAKQALPGGRPPVPPAVLALRQGLGGETLMPCIPPDHPARDRHPRPATR